MIGRPRIEPNLSFLSCRRQGGPEALGSAVARPIWTGGPVVACHRVGMHKTLTVGSWQPDATGFARPSGARSPRHMSLRGTVRWI